MAITPSLFSAITLMVLVTTFLAPPLLSRVSRGQRMAEREPEDMGIDDLVVGEWKHRSRQSVPDSSRAE